MKICIIPIDNRPVCYDLFKNISKIDEDMELFIPPKEYLGDLNKIADINNLFLWLEKIPKTDAIVLALDTLAYGGLIPSRRGKESFDEIEQRIKKLKTILLQKKSKVYAFSSVMRISNNNCNEEEKLYWDKYGKLIFDYSYNTHKAGCESCIERMIPDEILNDYLITRKRNFEINKIYLQWQKEGLFDTLIFSKDDCAEYGFNVQEANALKKLGGEIITGADEIPLTLFAKAIKGNVKVRVEFTEPESKYLISKYEDISVEQSVHDKLKLCGMNLVEANADINLVVNNFKNEQGEIVMKVFTEQFLGKFKMQENTMIADVRNANGADNNFVNTFINSKMPQNFYGYSAWNTSSNTLGSLFCAAKVKFLAKKYNDKAFKELQIIRLLDDWAYQANVRQNLNNVTEYPNMSEFENKISKFVEMNFNAKYYYPWNRLFEIGIEVETH
ncbi:DUF4127 family protein [bacterium]|nr:DUF4127 family protein [bacterium]